MDKIENTEKITPCAIKKIRASEVASVGELAVMKKVSERSELAFWKTSILAMKCAKWATFTTKLTHPICLAHITHSFRSSFIKNAPRFASLGAGAGSQVRQRA